MSVFMVEATGGAGQRPRAGGHLVAATVRHPGQAGNLARGSP
jgi:hypothetical protein